MSDLYFCNAAIATTLRGKRGSVANQYQNKSTASSPLSSKLRSCGHLCTPRQIRISFAVIAAALLVFFRGCVVTVSASNNLPSWTSSSSIASIKKSASQTKLVDDENIMAFLNRSTMRIMRGGSTPATFDMSAASSTDNPNGGSPSGTGSAIRVCYQGEPGAYSDKSTRELLGQNVLAIGRSNFESCFRAVASGECEYACLPVENSLGGSIHENYDLMMRYDLHIVAEHEFRVQHCLMAKEGVKRDQIKYAISHPQALAQCDNFLRGLGITPIPTYDTAGSAKMISTGAKLPPGCTPENTAAIASDLAAKIYGLHCLDVGVEDDDTNFTRFLLLARKNVAAFLTKKTPAKTSVVFTLPHSDSAGALYKALACFSLRDIDFSKIESRPTSASLLSFLKFKTQSAQGGNKAASGVVKYDLPRFRYCFYLDFLGNTSDEHTQHALAHLREQADFLRILGSYPQKSRLVGPVATSVEQMKHLPPPSAQDQEAQQLLPSDRADAASPLKIGVVGFDALGQFLAKRFSRNHRVSCLDVRGDKSTEAESLGIEYFPNFKSAKFLAGLDVVIIAVPLIDFEDTVQSLPIDGLKGKLIVETCALNGYPKKVMLAAFGNEPDIDIVSSHPMFGPVHVTTVEGGQPIANSQHLSDEDRAAWDGRTVVYEKVRVANRARCEQFLRVFEDARCPLVEMSAEQHDANVADADFVTLLTGRLLLDKQLLPPTPVASKECAALQQVVETAHDQDFNSFFGIFKFLNGSSQHLNKLRENLAMLDRQLAAKEAYLEARMEMKSAVRQRLVAETKTLLSEVVGSIPTTDVQDHSKLPKNDHKAVEADTSNNGKGGFFSKKR